MATEKTQTIHQRKDEVLEKLQSIIQVATLVTTITSIERYLTQINIQSG